MKTAVFVLCVFLTFVYSQDDLSSKEPADFLNTYDSQDYPIPKNIDIDNDSPNDIDIDNDSPNDINIDNDSSNDIDPTKESASEETQRQARRTYTYSVEKKPEKYHIRIQKKQSDDKRKWRTYEGIHKPLINFHIDQLLVVLTDFYERTLNRLSSEYNSLKEKFNDFIHRLYYERQTNIPFYTVEFITYLQHAMPRYKINFNGIINILHQFLLTNSGVEFNKYDETEVIINNIRVILAALAREPFTADVWHLKRDLQDLLHKLHQSPQNAKDISALIAKISDKYKVIRLHGNKTGLFRVLINYLNKYKDKLNTKENVQWNLSNELILSEIYELEKYSTYLSPELSQELKTLSLLLQEKKIDTNFDLRLYVNMIIPKMQYMLTTGQYSVQIKRIIEKILHILTNLVHYNEGHTTSKPPSLNSVIIEIQIVMKDLKNVLYLLKNRSQSPEQLEIIELLSDSIAKLERDAYDPTLIPTLSKLMVIVQKSPFKGVSVILEHLLNLLNNLQTTQIKPDSTYTTIKPTEPPQSPVNLEIQIILEDINKELDKMQEKPFSEVQFHLIPNIRNFIKKMETYPDSDHSIELNDIINKVLDSINTTQSSELIQIFELLERLMYKLKKNDHERFTVAPYEDITITPKNINIDDPQVSINIIFDKIKQQLNKLQEKTVAPKGLELIAVLTQYIERLQNDTESYKETELNMIIADILNYTKQSHSSDYLVIVKLLLELSVELNETNFTPSYTVATTTETVKTTEEPGETAVFAILENLKNTLSKLQHKPQSLKVLELIEILKQFALNLEAHPRTNHSIELKELILTILRNIQLSHSSDLVKVFQLLINLLSELDSKKTTNLNEVTSTEPTTAVTPVKLTTTAPAIINSNQSTETMKSLGSKDQPHNTLDNNTFSNKNEFDSPHLRRLMNYNEDKQNYKEFHEDIDGNEVDAVTEAIVQLLEINNKDTPKHVIDNLRSNPLTDDDEMSVIPLHTNSPTESSKNRIDIETSKPEHNFKETITHFLDAIKEIITKLHTNEKSMEHVVDVLRAIVKLKLNEIRDIVVKCHLEVCENLAQVIVEKVKKYNNIEDERYLRKD